jgi:hypothetical protein
MKKNCFSVCWCEISMKSTRLLHAQRQLFDCEWEPHACISHTHTSVRNLLFTSREQMKIFSNTRRLSRCDVAVEFNIMHTHLLKVAHQFWVSLKVVCRHLCLYLFINTTLHGLICLLTLSREANIYGNVLILKRIKRPFLSRQIHASERAREDGEWAAAAAHFITKRACFTCVIST